MAVCVFSNPVDRARGNPPPVACDRDTQHVCLPVRLCITCCRRRTNVGTLLQYEVPHYTLQKVIVLSHLRDAVVRVGISPSGRLAIGCLRRSGVAVVRNLDTEVEVLRHALHEVGGPEGWGLGTLTWWWWWPPNATCLLVCSSARGIGPRYSVTAAVTRLGSACVGVHSSVDCAALWPGCGRHGRRVERDGVVPGHGRLAGSLCPLFLPLHVTGYQ